MKFITDGAIFVVSFNATVGLMIGIIFLFLGIAINTRVAFLKKFTIPAPVTGGLIFCIIHLMLYKAGIVEFKFDVTLQGFFLNLFFTAIGFACSFGVLKKAGKLIVIFLLSTVVLTIVQNLIAVGVSKVMGIHPVLGLMAGSPALVGGLGNATAFGMIAEEWGHTGAVTFGVTASTFGLIAAVLFGNPAAELLIKIHKLPIVTADVQGLEPDSSPKKKEFNPKALQSAFLIIVLALGAGFLVQWLFNLVLPGVTIVTFVWGLTMGGIIRIVCDAKKIKLPEMEIEALGDTFLAVFVAMAVCTMQLWEIIDLALPLVAILVLNTIFTFLFVVFINFPLCGKNYDSACIASGMWGFGMGSTISSLVNLDGLSQKYTRSKIAYFVVPVVGALLSNYTNAVTINAFMTIFK
jgi:ESS family glutamate:Na+ symporter